MTSEEVLNYIIEINEGRCSISEDLISQKEDEEHQKKYFDFIYQKLRFYSCRVLCCLV